MNWLWQLLEIHKTQEKVCTTAEHSASVHLWLKSFRPIRENQGNSCLLVSAFPLFRFPLLWFKFSPPSSGNFVKLVSRLAILLLFSVLLCLFAALPIHFFKGSLNFGVQPYFNAQTPTFPRPGSSLRALRLRGPRPAWSNGCLRPAARSPKEPHGGLLPQPP
jgi:hypothetical protein